MLLAKPKLGLVAGPCLPSRWMATSFKAFSQSIGKSGLCFGQFAGYRCIVVPTALAIWWDPTE